MKKLSMLTMAAALMALLAPAAWGQMGTVKGTVKGPDGKPIIGAVVELTNKESGRKYQLKSDKHGNIFSLGITGGIQYDVTVTSDGKVIDKMNGFQVKSDEDNELDINIAEEQKQAQQQEKQAVASMTPEQKKQLEEQQKAVAEHNQQVQKVGKLNDMLAQARAASQAGNYEQAKELMLQATQIDQTHEILWFNLAEAQRNAALKETDPAEKKSGLEAAIVSYNKALTLTNNTKPDMMGAIYNNQGEAYAKLGDVDQAIKAYDSAATSDPQAAGRYYFNEGAVLTNAGKYDAAIAAFDKCIAADPTKADAYYQKGVNLIGKATTKPDGSMVAPPGTSEAFNKYLELAPTGPYAQSAKDMLAAIGSKVETSFGKKKK